MALLGALALGWSASRPANAQDEAQAASGPPLNVTVFVNSGSAKPCFGTGEILAINKLMTLAQDDINRRGGIHGRPVLVRILDDTDQSEMTVANVKSALEDPQSLAMFGLSNDFVGRIVFRRLEKQIADTKVPFISSISDSSIFTDIHHVFSTEPSRLDEGLPIIAAFIKHMSFGQVGFVGRAGSSGSREVGGGLLARLGFDNLVWDQRMDVKGGRLDPLQLRQVVARAGETLPGEDGKPRRIAMLVVDLQDNRAADLIAALHAAKVTPALFLTGDVDAMPRKIVDVYPNAIYQLAWDRLPEVYNDRILDVVDEEKPDQGIFAGRLSLDRIPEVYHNRVQGLVGRDRQHPWVFAGRKRADSPGWQSGFCKERPEGAIPNPLEPDNLRAVTIGARHADLLDMVVTAARTAGPGARIEALRQAVTGEFKTTYADGRGAYKGRLRNWSFDPQRRTATRQPFIVILPHGLGRKQLAPVQFARAKKRNLRQIDTLYLDIDLVRAHSIDDNGKSFLADFYVAMRGGKHAKIENLDFANAYLDPRTGGRQLTVQTLHDGGPSDIYPDTMRMYRISGRFLFKPELANYPFDSQRFSLDVQSRSGKNPFIVLPPPLKLRDKEVTTEGWIVKRQYVGYAADFVPVVDAFTHEPSIVPFYTASFVWKMKRETTDYFLRVVVPLAFILIVAYLSIFIPQSHLEAIVTIQITALLSAVALYLSLPKLEADATTISDRIFVFDYMMVSFMIVISILRINKRIAKRKWLDGVLSLIHIFLIPLIVLLMIFSVYQVSTLQT